MPTMRPMGVVQKLCIHHSAGDHGNVDVFRAEHKARKPPFADIGYHAVICNGKGGADGEVQPGRPEEFQGSGVWGNNANTLHVCLVGNFEHGRPTDEQLRSLGHWIINRLRRYTTGLDIFGHCEMTVPGHGTACPGAWFTRGLVGVPDQWRGHNRLSAVKRWARLRINGRTTMELDQWLRQEGLG